MPVRYLAPTQSKVNYTHPRSEVKCCDISLDLNPIPSTTNTNAAIVPVNCIQPGTGSWNRIGKKIKMKSFRWKGLLQTLCPAGTVTRNNGIRVSLVYDRQPSGNAIPTFDTIFGSTNQLGTESTLSFLDNLRVDNTERFVVLKDDVYSSDNQAITATNSVESTIAIDIFVKLKALDTVYSGQSNPCTIADISSGALYFILRSEENSTAIVSQFVNSVGRLRYYD